LLKQWIEIQWKSHLLYKSGAGHQAIQEAIFAAAVKHKVFLTPGTCFWSDASSKEDQMFFRATYASASRDDLTEAVRRFGEAIKSQFT
jgi:aromatic amino acid aminotransferase I